LRHILLNYFNFERLSNCIILLYPYLKILAIEKIKSPTDSHCRANFKSSIESQFSGYCGIQGLNRAPPRFLYKKPQKLAGKAGSWRVHPASFSRRD
jgi:hypothetical protein